MTARLKNVLTRSLYQLFLFLTAAVVALLLLEGGFRLARRGTVTVDRLEWRDDRGEATGSKVYEKTDEFEFAAAINRYGFRGPEISQKKHQGLKRILIVGDSFLFGWGVNDDQTFTHIVDREINGVQKRYEILNAAGGSLSPLIYYVMLKKRLLYFEPDVVVVFLNYADLREDHLSKRNIIRDQNGEIVDVDPLYLDGKLDFWRWLRSRCELCSFTFNRIARPLRKMQILGFWNYVWIKLKGGRSRDEMFERTGAQDKSIRAIEYDAYFMLREHVGNQEIQEAWRETAQYLSMIHGLLKERGIPMILAFFPHGIQVGSNQWAKGRARWGFEPGKTYDNPLMTELVRSYAQERGIGFVDLLPSFRQASDQLLFFEKDGHLKPAGHSALARGLLASPDFRRSLDLERSLRGLSP